MEKSNQLMIIVAAIAILACTFWAGYAIGLKQRAPMDPSAVQQAIHSRWVQADTPPSPAVTVQGKAIEVARGGYSWCKPVYNSKGSCVSVDSSILETEPVEVPAGAPIDTEAPKGIKEFTLTGMDSAGGALEHPYTVPQEKGIYKYRIHCEWFLDQGQSDFYFTLKVT
ncbi:MULTISPECIES: hypothetical protein [Paenibacillus]|uniref:hypothetical protein n=1 Tax=Paenibacillus TaxID=44249 RepID=UPI000684345D|nr:MULTISPECIES: hypothetical protein [Paenibacillus]SMF30586.1 hypothetical protein SAMN02744102_02535 [Paenibacillus barengoltzii]